MATDPRLMLCVLVLVAMLVYLAWQVIMTEGKR